MTDPKQEFAIISAIADRAYTLFTQHGINYEKMTAMMDIESAHKDIPLDLDALLNARDETFAHDVGGIRQHMDRSTFPGKLTDCFVPRTSLKPLP